MWMKHDQSQENTNTRANESSLLRCPMCKGRGYFEPSHVAATTTTNETETRPYNSLKLPSLQTKTSNQQWSKPRCKYTLPSIRNANTENKASELIGCNKSYPEDPGKDKEVTSDDIGSSVPLRSELRIKTGTSQRMSVDSSDSTVEKNLIPSPKTPHNPSENLKSSLTKLKAGNWNESVCALQEIVQISRFHPRLLNPCMVLVYRGLISLLRSFRSTVVRTACQASNELFATMGNTQRPEFDELINVLLLKTADTNKSVRQDANEALDTMVINISPLHSVRTLTQRGINHKNATVRTTTARLLVCVVGVVGVDAIYSGNKESRVRVMNAAATFLQDGCQEARNFGRRLMKMLMAHDDFEDLLHTSVNDVLLKRIEKTVITMKYKV